MHPPSTATVAQTTTGKGSNLNATLRSFSTTANTVRERLNEEEWTTAWEESRKVDLDQAVAYVFGEG